MNKSLSTSKTSQAPTNAQAAHLPAISHFEQLANGKRLLSDPQKTQPKGMWQRIIALSSYQWVLLTQAAVILPHIPYIPMWIIAYAIFTIIMQLPKVKSARFITKRLYQLIQFVGFVLGVVGLWITYNGTFGVDVGVAFLLLCLISKLWELYKRRDAYVVLNLSFFVLAALFLMDQGLTTTIEVIVATLMLLLAFISLNDDDNVNGSGRVRSLLLLAGQAVPLLVILFIFFPRLPPLWSLKMSSQQATTGVSDSMSPGDFSELSQSTELAFRAEFPNGVPSRSQLYWRGLVFTDFDGVTWTPSRLPPQWRVGQTPEWITQALQTVSPEQINNPYVYRIILEPTHQDWLYGLDYPLTKEEGVVVTSNFTLRRWIPVDLQYHYEVGLIEGMRIDSELSDAQRDINLQLPTSGNERSRQLAQELFMQSDQDPIKYINELHNWINTTEFRYTLSPPPLYTNRIDEFLFETKAGFCEHYSSSFTFMMRAAGIPARVVVGYQGGTLGRDGTSWEVRQMDAHAWSEVWIEGQGWVRVDPTAFIAPERVEQGMDAFTESRGADMFGSGATAALNYQQFRVAQSLRRLSDQISYYWQKDVVGFDQDKQANSLLKWFNIKSLMQQMLWMISTFAVIMALIIFMIWYRRRKRWHPVDLPLMQLSKRLAKEDESLKYDSQEGLLAWLERMEQQADNPEAKLALREVKQHYRTLRYGRLSEGDQSDSEYNEDYQKALKQLNNLSNKVK